MASDKEIIRQEAIGKLKNFGITDADIYLIDIIPLVEMIWADGQAQDSEIAILEDFLEKHVNHINTIAGYDLLTMDRARHFLARFIENRPNPEILHELRQLVSPVRLATSDAAANTELRESLLAVCLDIAASAVTQYPYGLRDRFNCFEKKCFFEIIDSL